ncbi:hypothetical protein BHM03_00008152 [Ensete ventricosum]|uniref:Uncharacterized protein n=1 Tax=Ensete ventricosum TaxID=4639 RepID=A0A426ZR27_ENSVE|nr:hypothetical protein B296_00040158 [Ensete ventricosum]RZR81848.1 hypothetical protein BHM03_00008152 [Ensete ventricosum]
MRPRYAFRAVLKKRHLFCSRSRSLPFSSSSSRCRIAPSISEVGHGVAGVSRQDAAPTELPERLAHRSHENHSG